MLANKQSGATGATGTTDARPQRLRPSLCLAAVLLACSLGVQAHALKPVTVVEGVSEYRLGNGMQVLLVPDTSKPTVTVNVTYRVGSRHENYGETGMAHLLEHLIFKGSPRHTDPWAEFSKRGFAANGSTWYDRTNYFASFAANDDNLKWYLNWQADAMVNSFIARKHLDTEMTVVRNEMERGENSAVGITIERTLSAMYQWHNYGKSTIGARADVENVDITRLQAFYRQYYQPDNATLIVSGSFDSNKVLDWVSAGFGKLPKPKRVLPPTYTVDPVQDGEREVTVRRVGGNAAVALAYAIPPGPSADYAALSALGVVLTDSPSGRLYKRLVEEKKLATEVFEHAPALAEPGFDLFMAMLTPQASVDEVKREMLSLVEGFNEQPVTAEELERAKTVWLNSWERNFTNPEAVGVYLSEYVSQGDWRLFFYTRDRIKALKLEDLQRVARERLIPANRTLAQYIPTEKPLRAPAPAKVDLAAEMKGFVPQAAATAVAVFEATPANIDKHTQLSTLGNGMKLVLLPKPTRGDAVQASLMLRVGSVEALHQRATTASLLGAMLSQGTQSMTRQQLHDAMNAAKVEWRVSANGPMVSVTWSTRRDQAARSLELVADVLRHPRLEASALEEVRGQALANIKAQRDEPQAVASRAMSVALSGYPAGDVRAVPSFDEEEAAVKALTLADVQRLQAELYGANAGALAVVGDFDAPALAATAARVLGDWTAKTPIVRVPKQPFPKPGRVQTLLTPDKQNATMLGGIAQGLNDVHPDRPALTVANQILGASGSSRLWKRIREKDGLSYGVGTGQSFSPYDPVSTWYVYAIFAPQNRTRVEAGLREEVARAIKDGFTAEELSAAKQAIANDSRLSLAQDANVAGMLAGNLFINRPAAHEQRFQDAVSKLTLDQVNDAFRRYFKLDDFQLVFAGDFK